MKTKGFFWAITGVAALILLTYSVVRTLETWQLTGLISATAEDTGVVVIVGLACIAIGTALPYALPFHESVKMGKVPYTEAEPLQAAVEEQSLLWTAVIDFIDANSAPATKTLTGGEVEYEVKNGALTIDMDDGEGESFIVPLESLICVYIREATDDDKPAELQT